MENIEKIVKEILKNSNINPNKIDKGWIYKVNAQGNPYEDFRDEYKNADMIDNRIAERTLPNTTQSESYLVVMSAKELVKAKLKEVHNTRFAEYTGKNLIVKKKEDVVDELMKKVEIKPEPAARKTQK